MSQKRYRYSTRDVIIVLVVLVLGFLAQQFLGGGEEPTEAPSVTAPAGTGVGNALRVYFTEPRYPDKPEDRPPAIDRFLVEAIDGAQKSVDMAAFELDLESVTKALIRAHQRGVRVRVVTDSDYAEEYGPVELQKAGVPVVFDEREPFMHNKFTVIDGKQVWMGSWNYTNNCTFRNNNNAVVFDSPLLAANYTAEFEEMFVDGKFGPTSPENVKYPEVTVGGIKVENYFASEDKAIIPRIVELVSGAQKSVYFMAFSFTDDDIAQAMVKRHRKGVTVRGVMEARNATGSGSEFEVLQKAGIDILPDGNPYVMHHKVIIIDEAIVITGSFNFTGGAAKNNDENLVIIHSPEVAALYKAEFDRVYARAQQP